MASDKSGMQTQGYPHAEDIPKQTQTESGKRVGPGLDSELHSPAVFTDIPTATGDGTIRAMEYRSANKLQGKKALITGGDSGIGRAVAVMMAKEGADVAIVYLPDEESDAKDTKEMVEKEGNTCITIAKDISEEDNCRDIIQQVVDQFGRLDILVNNAALQELANSIEETSTDKLERHFRTNIFSMFYLVKYALPHMKRGASIINTTSLTAYQGNSTLLEYSSTKGAIVAFTRSLSQQLAPKGIRVNAVAPGPVWTPLNPASRDADNTKSMVDSGPPLGRITQPAEIAPSFVFLASGEASQFTGQVLHPNGGYVLNT